MSLTVGGWLDDEGDRGGGGRGGREWDEEKWGLTGEISGNV